MATANLGENVTVSEDAVRLLTCFADELDATALEIAHHFAKGRRSADDKSTSVEIEADDVKRATRFIIDQLRKQIAEGTLPPHVKEAVDGIEECFKEKCGERHDS